MGTRPLTTRSAGMHMAMAMARRVAAWAERSFTKRCSHLGRRAVNPSQLNHQGTKTPREPEDEDEDRDQAGL